MKLYLFKPTNKLAKNISKISTRLGIEVSTTESDPLSGIIVIGNGTPDDQVVAVISHRLNGKKVVGIAKPTKKWLGVFNSLPVYLRHLKEGMKLAILIDQETESLESIFNEIKKRVKELYTVKARDIAKELGSARSANLVLLARYLRIEQVLSPNVVKEAIFEVLGEKKGELASRIFEEALKKFS